MRWPGSSLSAKILLAAFLNVLFLALVFFSFARFQFRLDLSSFFLAPARDKILSVSRLAALQLVSTNPSAWHRVLSEYSATYPAEFYLFNDAGSELAGLPVQLPPEFVEALNRTRWRRGSIPGRPLNMMLSPPLSFTRTNSPTQYWAGVHVPIWTKPGQEPIHATVVWRFRSFWTQPFFFDYRPWLAVVLAVVFISVLCWLPLIRGLTKAISQLTVATGQIAEGHFEIEVSTKRRDELGRLSESINRMAQRLSGLVHGQRRFLSDIAHELCSPLARIQMAVGILEQRAGDKEMEYVADVREEVEHMSGLVGELLAFSKSQRTDIAIALTSINVAATVRRVLEREGSKEAVIETDIDEGIEVIAQVDYLFRSLANVVRNAVRYAAQGGPIVVSASRRGGEVAITVADQGPGLPDSELENIFRPFYRPEFARQRETGGTGLGLAIVRNCIEACGGAVKCQNRSSRGLAVEIRLPSAVR